MNRKIRSVLLLLLMSLALLTGCKQPVQEPASQGSVSQQSTEAVFDPASVPAYAGKAYAAINGNQPFFRAEECTDQSFETYTPFDGLGRCGVAFASVGQDLMPTEDRGAIGSVKPSGWHTAKYDCIQGKYLYNRCHLIGFQLTGENANPQNLITGTRYLNIDGMLPFENLVADYVKETGNHVMYRVTPVFRGKNLVADGVLMEGYSVEDAGEGVSFCVFAYNVQPGVSIDYATGESVQGENSSFGPEGTTEDPAENRIVYVSKSGTRYHFDKDCASKNSIAMTLKEAEEKGYTPCKKCVHD